MANQQPYYCTKCSKKHYRGNVYKDHKKYIIGNKSSEPAFGNKAPKKRKIDLKTYRALLNSGKLYNTNGTKYYRFILLRSNGIPMNFIITLTWGQISKIDSPNWVRRNGKTICSFRMSTAWMAKLLINLKQNYRPKKRAVLTM